MAGSPPRPYPRRDAARRRADVDELNRAAHALMLRSRRLGHQAVKLSERELRVGEQVLCRRNDSRLGLRNGTRGTIVRLDERGFVVRDEGGVDRHVTFTRSGAARTGRAEA